MFEDEMLPEHAVRSDDEYRQLVNQERHDEAIEGFMRGGDSRKEYDAAALKEVVDERDELQELFDLQWAADQRAIKRWQAAHPGRGRIWPDRADMVVWLMDQHDKATAPIPQSHEGT
jgi:hypothetical protein